MLATEIARIRVASGRKGHSEKVKEILERDSNVVQLIKDNPAPARIIIIPKEFQEEGFVAAFASSQTASVDSSKVLYMHTQNTVMDPELVPSFLQYLSHQEFPSQSYLFILDAETLVDPHKNSSSLAEVASLFKDKPNLKTFIFTSLKTEREPQVHGTVVIDLFSYFREQAENYARVQIDSDTTISQFIAKRSLDKSNQVFRLTRKVHSAPQIYSTNSILNELTSCVVDTGKGIWAVIKLSFYLVFGFIYIISLIADKSAKNEKPDRVDEMLRNKNLGYVIRDYKGGETCPICLEQIRLIALMTACKHLYHLECIRDWVKRNSNCPLCRKPVALPEHVQPARH